MHEGVAVGATLIAVGACIARGALVHGVLEEAALSLEFGSKTWQVQESWWLMAQSIGALLAGSRAVALLGCAERTSTDQARGRRTRRV
jgi:hypothetical protein